MSKYKLNVKELINMKKFVCSICGYVHEEDMSPEFCPICKVKSDKFIYNFLGLG